MKNTIYSQLHSLQMRQDVTEIEVKRFGNKVNDFITGLNEHLDKLDDLTFVKLPNIDSLDELKEAIVTSGSFQKETGAIFENGGFDRLMISLENAIVHCQRIDQKSVGAILDYHHKLQEQL